MLSDEDREALLTALIDEYGGERADWTELRSLTRIGAVVEQIATKRVTAALNDAADRIAEFDPSDDYHRNDYSTPGYYSGTLRAEALLRGEITCWTDPPPT